MRRTSTLLKRLKLNQKALGSVRVIICSSFVYLQITYDFPLRTHVGHQQTPFGLVLLSVVCDTWHKDEYPQRSLLLSVDFLSLSFLLLLATTKTPSSSFPQPLDSARMISTPVYIEITVSLQLICFPLFSTTCVYSFLLWCFFSFAFLTAATFALYHHQSYSLIHLPTHFHSRSTTAVLKRTLVTESFTNALVFVSIRLYRHQVLSLAFRFFLSHFVKHFCSVSYVP